MRNAIVHSVNHIKAPLKSYLLIIDSSSFITTDHIGQLWYTLFLNSTTQNHKVIGKIALTHVYEIDMDRILDRNTIWNINRIIPATPFHGWATVVLVAAGAEACHSFVQILKSVVGQLPVHAPTDDISTGREVKITTLHTNILILIWSLHCWGKRR